VRFGIRGNRERISAHFAGGRGFPPGHTIPSFSFLGQHPGLRERLLMKGASMLLRARVPANLISATCTERIVPADEIGLLLGPDDWTDDAGYQAMVRLSDMTEWFLADRRDWERIA
jgi:hypothetical protein